MDIIAAHQHGLIEQLDAEVAALAGRARDHGQRAVVLHHLYDHGRGAHEWALGEARQQLRIAARLKQLERRLDRWGWSMRSADAARVALAALGDALGEAAHARMAVAYRAYRVSATKALRGEAETSVPPSLLALMDQCHAARREGQALAADSRKALLEESERLAAAAVDGDRLDDAWSAIGATGIGRSTRRLLGAAALARAQARDERNGWTEVERKLVSDPVLPAAFRANPAQHFYALQHMLLERRRQQWREACDREEDAVQLAA